MNYEIAASIIGLALLGFFMAYLSLYYSNMVKSQQIREVKETKVAVDKTLDRFFEKSEKGATLQKLAAINKLKQEMEAKIGVKTAERKEKAKVQLANKPEIEDEIIDQGGQVYLSFTEGLISAAPSNLEEKNKDMNDLLAAVKALEMMDKKNYKMPEDKNVDVAKGMLYDSISSRLDRIIRKNKFKQFAFIQAAKLESYAYGMIKRLEHEDYMQTLQIMKEVGTIKDLIELNTQTTLIVFSKEKIHLNQAEKVVIAFAAEEDILTINRLQTQTLWKPAYLNRTLKSLEKKKYLEIKDNNLEIIGMITREERENLQKKRVELQENKKLRETKSKKLEDELLEQKRLKEEEDEIKNQEMLKQRQEILLKEARIKAEEEAKQRRIEAERRSEIEEKERLEKIKAMPKPNIKMLPLPSMVGRPVAKPVAPLPLPLPIQAPKPVSKIEAKSPAKPTDVANKIATESKILSEQMDKLMTKSENVDDLDFSDIPDLPIPDESGFDDGQTHALGVPSGDGFGDEDGLDSLKALIGKMESKETETKIPKSGDNLTDFFSDDDESELISDEVSENQEMIDDIVNMLNDVGQISGGIITFKALHDQLKAGPYPDLKKMDLMEVIDEIKEQQIIMDEISMSGTDIYVFEDKVFDDDMNTLIRQFIINGKLDLEDIEAATDWEIEKTNRVLKRFEDQYLVKKNKDNEYYMPGLFNT
jgi:hypothetical protein